MAKYYKDMDKILDFILQDSDQEEFDLGEESGGATENDSDWEYDEDGINNEHQNNDDDDDDDDIDHAESYQHQQPGGEEVIQQTPPSQDMEEDIHLSPPIS